jgi:hypothetical protein
MKPDDEMFRASSRKSITYEYIITAALWFALYILARKEN